MKAGTILIRADASPQMGMGHVMRMLALAQAWRRRDGDAVFAAVELSEALKQRLEGFSVFENSGTIPGSVEDAAWTAALVQETGASWIVADGYSFGTEFQELVSRASARVAVVCDYPVDEAFACDVVINQNLSAGRNDYPSLLPEAKGLFGSDFALLREEFVASPRKSRKPTIGVGKRLLITLGGSDPVNFSARLVRLLGPVAELEDWEIELLVGPGNVEREQLRALCQECPRITLTDAVADMGVLLEGVDAVLSAGGSTCWELCFRGLPMAVVSIAENQNAIVRALGEAEAAVDLGWHELVTDGDIISAVRGILGDPEKRRALSATGLRLIDGRGADRVAAALHGSLHVVIATAAEGWVRGSLDRFLADLKDQGHKVSVVTRAVDIPVADLVFFLSFWSLADISVLDRVTHSLVVHASDLPKGKGWSPLTWQILEGKDAIPVRLFEAEETVDSGDIYASGSLKFRGHELLGELRDRLLDITYSLCLEFVSAYPENIPQRKQQIGEASFYDRRTPRASRLDPDRTIADQFNLLRTVDNQSYPAFFEYLGHRYELQIRECKKS